MARIEKIVAKLPEAERVDVAEWGDHPTFRVRGKIFIFCDAAGRDLSVKLTRIAFHVPDDAGAERWREVEEWIRTSYTLVAPKRLARQVEEAAT